MSNKSSLSDLPGDLNNAQLTDIIGRDEYWILLDVPYLTSPWGWVAWTALITMWSLTLNAIFFKQTFDLCLAVMFGWHF